MPHRPSGLSDQQSTVDLTPLSQMDVFLGTPIYGPEDLPEQITFNLYDSKDAFTLATIVRINIDEDDKTKRGEML